MIIRIRKIHIFIFAIILVSISFISAIRSEEIEKTSVKDTGINLPIVMYHHITENEEKAGKYVITTKELEEDLIYLNTKGYTTVLVGDLINFMEGTKELPEKIIMITFDDGFKSVIKLGLPILEKHKTKAVIAPIGTITEEYTQNKNTDINYSYLTWDELKILNDNPLIEIQSHTYDMHNLTKKGGKRNGLSKMTNETDDEYRNALASDLTRMQNELMSKSGINATAIAYPYGLYSQSTLSAIKELGFYSNFLCEEKINMIYKGDKNTLYNLGRFNRPSGIKTEDFFKRMKVF